MQAEPQPRTPNLRQQHPVRQADPLMLSEVQVASTSPASEQAWIMVILVLAVLVVGLYLVNGHRSRQPGRSTEGVVADRAAVEGPADALTGDPILSDQGNPTIPSSQNERLVRRYYDEVLNRQRIGVMDDLFAEYVAYRHDEPMMTLSLATLKQQLKAKSIGYAGLSYSVEQVIASGDWVYVDWSAVGRPLLSWTEYPPTGEPQVWSGYTAWKVVGGKIVQMRTYDVSKPQPYPTDDDEVRLPGPLQDIQAEIEYQSYLNDGYLLP